MMGEFLRRTPAADREALKYVIADSYETGPQNWTDGMAAKFEQRFGYRLAFHSTPQVAVPELRRSLQNFLLTPSTPCVSWCGDEPRHYRQT